jgi:hypothetical protein
VDFKGIIILKEGERSMDAATMQHCRDVKEYLFFYIITEGNRML